MVNKVKQKSLLNTQYKLQRINRRERKYGILRVVKMHDRKGIWYLNSDKTFNIF